MSGDFIVPRWVAKEALAQLRNNLTFARMHMRYGRTVVLPVPPVPGDGIVPFDELGVIERDEDEDPDW